MAAPTITDSVPVAGTGAGPIVTGNLTIASGDVCYVFGVLSDGSPGTLASVTSSGGGGAFSSIADSGVVESFLRCHVYRSTSPTAGTVTISVTPTASTGEIVVIAVSVAGVDAGTPNGSVVFANGNGTADATSGSVSSSTNAIVLDICGRFQNAAQTAGAGQTILDRANQGGTLEGSSSWEAGAATVTTSWAFNGAGSVSNWQWVLGALSINGSAAPKIDQEGFRFGFDDGAESSHSHAATMDTNLTAPAGLKRLLNIIANATGSVGAKNFKLQMLRPGGGANDWEDVQIKDGPL